MAKEFKDFTFMGKKLSDLSVKYVSVDFYGDGEGYGDWRCKSL